MRVESKGLDPINVNDYRAFCCCTNNRDAFKIAEGDRRHVMLEADDRYSQMAVKEGRCTLAAPRAGGGAPRRTGEPSALVLAQSELPSNRHNGHGPVPSDLVVRVRRDALHASLLAGRGRRRDCSHPGSFSWRHQGPNPEASSAELA